MLFLTITKIKTKKSLNEKTNRNVINNEQQKTT